jgi:plastocyanin
MLQLRSMWIISAAFAMVSCGSSGGTEPPPPPSNNPGGGGPTGVSVTVRNNNYSPNQVTVTAGGTVSWEWNSCSGDGYGGQTCTSHSVTFASGPNSPVQSEGSFTRTFASPGTFTYQCETHRGAMSGSVVVQ